MSRVGKTVFLLGVPRALKHVLSKLPWIGSVVCFENYGALLVALREAQALESKGGSASAPMASIVVTSSGNSNASGAGLSSSALGL